MSQINLEKLPVLKLHTLPNQLPSVANVCAVLCWDKAGTHMAGLLSWKLQILCLFVLDICAESLVRKALIDFLRGLVEFDPVKRWSPLQVHTLSFSYVCVVALLFFSYLFHGCLRQFAQFFLSFFGHQQICMVKFYLRLNRSNLTFKFSIVGLYLGIFGETVQPDLVKCYKVNDFWFNTSAASFRLFITHLLLGRNSQNHTDLLLRLLELWVPSCSVKEKPSVKLNLYE